MVGLIAVVLAGLLLARLIVVATTNADRLAAEELENLDISGRYYPIRRICPVIDQGEIEEAIDATLRREGLVATGNGFDVAKDSGEVIMSCGWRNRTFDFNPRVAVTFSAAVFAGTGRDPVVGCEPDAPGTTVRPVEFGGYRGCGLEGAGTATFVVLDDNVRVRCSVQTAQTRTPAELVAKTRRECERLLDHLADARPVSFLGPTFWTVT